LRAAEISSAGHPRQPPLQSIQTCRLIGCVVSLALSWRDQHQACARLWLSGHVVAFVGPAFELWTQLMALIKKTAKFTNFVVRLIECVVVSKLPVSFNNTVSSAVLAVSAR
jgi:hypothetical protein